MTWLKNRYRKCDIRDQSLTEVDLELGIVRGAGPEVIVQEVLGVLLGVVWEAVQEVVQEARLETGREIDQEAHQEATAGNLSENDLEVRLETCPEIEPEVRPEVATKLETDQGQGAGLCPEKEHETGTLEAAVGQTHVQRA